MIAPTFAELPLMLVQVVPGPLGRRNWTKRSGGNGRRERESLEVRTPGCIRPETVREAKLTRF